MASPSKTAKSFILESVVHGHHIYDRICTPVSMKTCGNVLTIENKINHIRTYIMFVRTHVNMALSRDQCTTILFITNYISLFL